MLSLTFLRECHERPANSKEANYLFSPAIFDPNRSPGKSRGKDNTAYLQHIVLDFEDGEVRLHIPVITNPDLEFILAGNRVVMQEGECWYLNVNQPHSVNNRGTTDRIHLVVDCVVNDWLRSLMLSTAEGAK